ncbi:LAFE_0H09406g1_1 [Lachancea fermentati]|uniref:LAFE_0H09406g1_1 n=1 Tax=Lachancea fermentati TaxID=4955 RepID=A0A1G4MK93_LACFM|nr:LAFE_0H09406g1_1 [Lachancea fermentati]
MNPYETLEVDRNASQEEIRKAYRRLALQHHPDKVSDESQRATSEIRFKEIAVAYEILSDEQRREHYDTYGDASAPENGSGGFDEGDFASFFQQFGGDSYEEENPRRTSDVHIPMRLSMKELYNGRTVRFQAKRNIVCNRCEGSGIRKRARHAAKCGSCDGQGVKQRLRRVGPGFVTRETVECEHCLGLGRELRAEDRCKKCQGKRVVSEGKTLSVYVPRGSCNGDTVVLKGEADEEPGKSTGDLVFDIEEDVSSSTLERRGNDLYTHLTITLAEALTGFEKEVCTTFDDRLLRLKIPMGQVIRPGNYICLTSEGWPLDDKGRSFGDMYININIEFPPDRWFSERGDVQALRNLLPQADSASKGANPLSASADPANTEVPSQYKIISSADELPDYISEESAHNGAQCAQQ